MRKHGFEVTRLWDIKYFPHLQKHANIQKQKQNQRKLEGTKAAATTDIVLVDQIEKN